jgi:hypothetical protein
VILHNGGNFAVHGLDPPRLLRSCFVGDRFGDAYFEDACVSKIFATTMVKVKVEVHKFLW